MATKTTLLAFRLTPDQVEALDSALATLKIPASLGLSRNELSRHVLMDWAASHQPKRPRKE